MEHLFELVMFRVVGAYDGSIHVRPPLNRGGLTCIERRKRFSDGGVLNVWPTKNCCFLLLPVLPLIV